MPRIRSIKPDFWTDYRVARDLTRDQRLFYIALWNEADDEGRFLAHPRRLLGAIFPYDEDLTEEFVSDSLRALAMTNRLVLYVIDGEPYGQLTKFSTHQRINRATPSRIPPPPTTCEGSVNPHGFLTDASTPRARVREVEGERGTGSYTIPNGMGKSASDEPPEELEEEVSVPNDVGLRPVVFQPPAIDGLPFTELDWHGRTTGANVLRVWIGLQSTPPSRSDRDRFGRACRLIADEHTVGAIALAFLGMRHLWPYAPPPEGKGQPWDPIDFRRVFAKAVAAAGNHPALKELRQQREFRDALNDILEGEAPW